MNSSDKNATSAPEAPKPSENPRSGKRGKTTTRRSRWRRWRWPAALALVALLWAVFYMGGTAVTVDASAVERGMISVRVEEQGQTRARYRYTVAAPITGRLLRTPFDAGDEVRRGDVLARMAPPPTDARSEATARAQLAAAEAREREALASRAEAQAQLRQARDESDRRTALFARQLVSAEQRDAFVQAFESAQARLQSSEASVRAAQAETRSALSALLGAGSGEGAEGLIDILAPVDGRVLQVIEESERVLSAGAPLFLLSEGDTLELVIDVLTEQAVQVRAGNPMEVSGWGGGEVIEARVRQIEPGAFTKISALGVEEQRVNVIADLATTPAELGAGFRIEASIITWSGEALRVPTGALFRRDGGWQVFAIEAGKARLRALRIGQRGKDFAEVLSGLEEGEQVILYPTDQIENEVAVAISQ